jgi:hypothetical protein
MRPEANFFIVNLVMRASRTGKSKIYQADVCFLETARKSRLIVWKNDRVAGQLRTVPGSANWVLKM